MSTLRLKLKRIDPVKYAVITALLMVLISLIVFVPVMLIASVFGVAGLASDITGASALFGEGAVMLLFAPILCGIFGFIIGVISTMLLNFILKKTGGLDIDFEKSGLDVSQIEKPTID